MNGIRYSLVFLLALGSPVPSALPEQPGKPVQTEGAGQAAIAGGPPAPDEAAIPQAYDIARYQFIWEKSPFTLSSAAEEPVANFAANYALVGQGFIGGRAYVRILDKTSQQRFTVAEGEPANGVELISLEASNDPLESTARVRKGSETGVLRFDPALLSAASAAPPAVPAVPQPPGNVQPDVNKPTQTPPGTNIPAPRRRRIIVPSSR